MVRETRQFVPTFTDHPESYSVSVSAWAPSTPYSSLTLVGANSVGVGPLDDGDPFTGLYCAVSNGILAKQDAFLSYPQLLESQRFGVFGAVKLTAGADPFTVSAWEFDTLGQFSASGFPLDQFNISFSQTVSLWISTNENLWLRAQDAGTITQNGVVKTPGLSGEILLSYSGPDLMTKYPTFRVTPQASLVVPAGTSLYLGCFTYSGGIAASKGGLTSAWDVRATTKHGIGEFRLIATETETAIPPPSGCHCAPWYDAGGIVRRPGFQKVGC